MANENALKDENNSRSLLITNAAGTETRKVRGTSAGAMFVAQDVAGSEDTAYSSVDVDETEEEVSAVPCFLRGYFITNRSNGERTFRFYDGLASVVTVGTTTPKLRFTLAAGQSANISDLAIKFSTAMCIAATTGVADNDTGAPGANEVVANIYTRAV